MKNYAVRDFATVLFFKFNLKVITESIKLGLVSFFEKALSKLRIG